MSEAGLVRVAVKLPGRLLERGLSLRVSFQQMIPRRHSGPDLLTTYVSKRILKSGLVWILPTFECCLWYLKYCTGKHMSKAKNWPEGQYHLF